MSRNDKPVTSADPTIVVRSEVESGKRYGEYRQPLRRDFFHTCAYCTINEFEAQSIRMTIDHYHPRNARPDLENEYSNLMYACGICNERKGDRDPPPEAAKQGKRFFRADQDARSDHFETKGLTIKSKTDVGEFTIQYLDLNRAALQKIRDLRERMTNCAPLVSDGIMALRNFRIDQIPVYVRSKANTTIQSTVNFADSVDEEIDGILLKFAQSELIEPDESSEERAKARAEYTKGLNSMFPGQSFRAPRKSGR